MTKTTINLSRRGDLDYGSGLFVSVAIRNFSISRFPLFIFFCFCQLQSISLCITLEMECIIGFHLDAGDIAGRVRGALKQIRLPAHAAGGSDFVRGNRAKQ